MQYLCQRDNSRAHLGANERKSRENKTEKFAVFASVEDDTWANRIVRHKWGVYLAQLNVFVPVHIPFFPIRKLRRSLLCTTRVCAHLLHARFVVDLPCVAVAVHSTQKCIPLDGARVLRWVNKNNEKEKWCQERGTDSEIHTQTATARSLGLAAMQHVPHESFARVGLCYRYVVCSAHAFFSLSPNYYSVLFFALLSPSRRVAQLPLALCLCFY